MHPLRRMIGLVTGVLVLQLTLLGAAAPCADAAMAGMADAHETHAPTAAAESTVADCDQHPAEKGAPARSGTAPCFAMISCVTPLAQIAAQPSLAESIAAFALVVAPDLEPPTRNTLPELPPPRA